VIESKAGAGGALAWSGLNQYAGDGYTIMGTNLPHIVLQPLEGNVQYKTEDITNVNFFNYTPDAIVVRNESPFKTFQEFVAGAKAKPNSLNLAGSGTNSANHAAFARLNAAAKIDTDLRGFQGNRRPDRVTARRARGRRDVVLVARASRSAARLGLLAVATPQRLPYFPDVPTFRELGIDWVDGAYRGVGVPKSTPEDMRRRISWHVLGDRARRPTSARRWSTRASRSSDIGYDKMAAFMEERKKAYLDSARLLGLVK
jgi:tripartite-type tricarboxylate transporter receptor subunit TctC